MDIGSVANFLAVVVEIIAIIVAIYQFKKTVDSDAKARKEEAEARIKNEAFCVDAWIAVLCQDTRKTCLVVRNETAGAIRSISLTIVQDGKIKNAPGTREPWSMIPKGSWVIEESQENRNYDWGFPKFIPESELNDKCPPLFTKQEANRVKAIKFTDIYGNEWERTFAFGNEKDSLTIREKQQ